MNNRLLHILIALIVSMVLWGLYAKQRIARSEYLAERGYVMGYNQGVDDLAQKVIGSRLIRTDESMGQFLDLEGTLRKPDVIWNGLDDHLAVTMFAIPGAAMSVLVIVTLLLEARSRNQDGR